MALFSVIPALSVSTSEIPIYSYVPVSNANVQYFEKDVLISSLSSYNSGDYYETDYKPLVNTEYKIILY